MLHPGIHKNYLAKKEATLAAKGVQLEYRQDAPEKEWRGAPAIASTSGAHFLANPHLHEEVFGPFTLLVKCKDAAEMEQVAAQLDGQLTATLMGQPGELQDWYSLLHILEEKAGRLIFNGVPTGVEVGHAMQHGGPYPATTDSRFTSVGTGAIRRFARPVAYQDFPDAQLPPELQGANPLGIVRRVNGEWQTP
jgi:NADP-dependent aldehyde dehydrogenase